MNRVPPKVGAPLVFHPADLLAVVFHPIVGVAHCAPDSLDNRCPSHAQRSPINGNETNVSRGYCTTPAISFGLSAFSNPVGVTTTTLRIVMVLRVFVFAIGVRCPPVVQEPFTRTLFEPNCAAVRVSCARTAWSLLSACDPSTPSLLQVGRRASQALFRTYVLASAMACPAQ